VSISPGTHRLGPDNGTLTVRTGRTGAVAKAGHDLLLEVTEWSATLDGATVALTADATSLKVREGTGGIKSLDDDDKANIEQTIDDEVLEGATIEFHSSSVEVDGERLRVRGELELGGKSQPIVFDLLLTDDRLAGSAVVKQTDWGIKPYSALFGTLKVADEVTVSIDATTRRDPDG
jgi:polyisoprenoid-binding protein YceI